MNEIFLDGVKYILAADAGKHAGLTRDYVTRLCREGKVSGTQAGKNWYVNQEALHSFILMKEREQISRSEELAHQLAQEYRTAHGLPAERHGLPNVVAKNIVSLNAPQSGASATASGSRASAAPHRPPQAIHHALHSAHGLSSISATPEISTRPEARMRSSELLPEISPVEFAHKLTALVVVALLAIGTYAMVDTRSARVAEEKMQNAALATVSGLPSSEPSAGTTPLESQEPLTPYHPPPEELRGTAGQATAAYYLSKAGEGVSTGISSAISSATQNLSLAGITLANEIKDSIVAAAESIKTETVNLAVNTKDAIVAEAESITLETAELAQKTKDAVVAEAESVKAGAVALATGARNTAVAFTNEYAAHALALARGVGGTAIAFKNEYVASALALARGVHTLGIATGETVIGGGEAVLSHALALGESIIHPPAPAIAERTPAGAHQASAFAAAKERGLALLKETTLLDSFIRPLATQLAAATVTFPTLSFDIIQLLNRTLPDAVHRPQ